MSPADDERRARERLRSLARARRARAAQLAAQRREDARRWDAFAKWCQRERATHGEYRAALEASGAHAPETRRALSAWRRVLSGSPLGAPERPVPAPVAPAPAPGKGTDTLKPQTGPKRLTAQLDMDGNAHEIAPRHESMHLFNAPRTSRGQMTLGGIA